MSRTLGLLQYSCIFALAVLQTACGGGGGGSNNSTSGSNGNGTWSAVSGVAQKGPLIKASTVTAQELSASLAPNGKSYNFQITSDLGTFTPNATFGSQYIGLSASGYYFDEVQGTVSGGTITLNGMSDLGSSSVLNVNLLTTLAYQRIIHLVTVSGMSVPAATTQAENEVLSALHIPNGASYGNFGTLDLSQSGSGNKILVGVSSLFVEAADTAAGSSGNASGQLASLMASFQSDIADNGKIDTAATLTILASSGKALNPAAVASNLSQRYNSASIAFSASDITNWIDTQGNGVVGAFTFQPATGASSSSFTFPATVVSAVAGTVVTVSSGQLLVNGVAVSSATIQAGDTIAVNEGSATTPPSSETVYLQSNGDNVADVALTPAYTGLSLLAGSIGGVGNINGTGAAARFSQPEGMAMDASGNLYIADRVNATIRKVSPSGAVTTLAGSTVRGSANGTGTAASFTYPVAVAVDGAGNVFVADTGNNLIRKVTTAGVVTTVAGTVYNQYASTGCLSADGTGTAARFCNPSGITVDGGGSLYVFDGGNATVRKITSAGVVTTMAGTAGLAGSADGKGPTARFAVNSGYSVAGMALDGAGNLFVADGGNDTIRKISSTGVVTTLAGAAGQLGTSDGSGSAARFSQPAGLGVDVNGTVYVSDGGNNTIRRITTSGVVTTLAGAQYATTPSLPFCQSADGSGTAARFCRPSGIALDASGNLLVGDAGNATVRKVSPSGAVTTLAGMAAIFGIADGTGAAVEFGNPGGPAIDASGNIYVADSWAETIRKITPSGVVTTMAGLAGQSGSADGTGSTARFGYPAGVAVDGSGNVYVADSNNANIRKISPAGVVTTLAGTAGVYGSADGIGADAQFQNPSSIGTDSAGNLYVTDGTTIRKITPAGLVTTLAGVQYNAQGTSTSQLTCQSTDGAGTAARFCDPEGIAVDRSGNVYVADTFNDTIRRITPAGAVTTLAGTAHTAQDGQCQSADGTGASAAFCFPNDIAIDSSGNLLVSDSSNSTIRKVTPAGVVTTVVGVAGMAGNVLTSLPASVDFPSGVAVTVNGQLVITSGNAVLITGIGGF